MSSLYDARTADGYLLHLLKAGTVRVGAKALISADNDLTIPSGKPVSPDEANEWIGTTFKEPLDACLELDDKPNSDTLDRDFRALIEEEADLYELDEFYQHQRRIRHLCHTSHIPEIMLQKLGVLRSALPRVYQRALFAAWFGTLIAYQRQLSTADIEALFKAGLYHDLGLLHVPPELVGKSSGLTAEDWASVQRHVIVGARICGEFANAGALVTKLVLQHHERADGSGYPSAASADELDPLSGVITLCDMAFSLRFPKVLLNSDSLSSLLPHFLVNRDSFGRDNGRTATAILHAARQRKNDRSATERGNVELKSINERLVAVCSGLDQLRVDLAGADSSVLGRSMLMLLEQIEWATLASGFGIAELVPWFERGIDERGDPQALHDMRASALEIFWLIHRGARLGQSLMGTLSSAEANASLERFLTRVDTHRQELAHILGV